MVLWLFFLLAYLERDGSPFSMFKVDLRKSLFTYFAATIHFAVAAVVVSFFGTGGLPRASGEPPRRRFTDGDETAPPLPFDLPEDDGGVVAFIFTP